MIEKKSEGNWKERARGRTVRGAETKNWSVGTSNERERSWNAGATKHVAEREIRPIIPRAKYRCQPNGSKRNNDARDGGCDVSLLRSRLVQRLVVRPTVPIFSRNILHAFSLEMSGGN